MAITKHNFKSGGVILASDFNQLENDIDNSLKTYLPLSGGTMSGTLYFQNGNFSFKSAVAHMDIGYDYDAKKGSGIALRSSSYSTTTQQGAFLIYARDSEGTTKQLIGLPSGALTWDGKEVERIIASGDGYIRYQSGLQICWGTKEVTTEIQNAWGSVFESPNILELTRFTYPQTFLSGKYSVMVSVVGGNAWIEDVAKGEGGSCAVRYLIRPLSTESKTYTIQYLIVGRWK